MEPAEHFQFGAFHGRLLTAGKANAVRMVHIERRGDDDARRARSQHDDRGADRQNRRQRVWRLGEVWSSG